MVGGGELAGEEDLESAFSLLGATGMRSSRSLSLSLSLVAIVLLFGCFGCLSLSLSSASL